MSEAEAAIAELQTLHVVCCGKIHELQDTDFDACPLRAVNLVCGHPEKIIFALRRAYDVACSFGFSPPDIDGMPMEVFLRITVDHRLTDLDDEAFARFTRTELPTGVTVKLIQEKERQFGVHMQAVQSSLLRFLQEALLQSTAVNA